MNKKKKCLLLCAMIGTLSACGNTPTQADAESAAMATIDQKALPPLSEDLQELYEGAYQIYYQISFGAFDYDEAATLKKNDLLYYKITDARFQTYDAFRTYLLQYFTESFVDNSILCEDNLLFTASEDGYLYSLPGGRGTNIFYAGHTFEIEKKNENTISLLATAYYTNSNEAFGDKHFYTAPKKPEDYTTQQFRFVLQKEAGQWKYNTFHLFF